MPEFVAEGLDEIAHPPSVWRPILAAGGVLGRDQPLNGGCVNGGRGLPDIYS